MSQLSHEVRGLIDRAATELAGSTAEPAMTELRSRLESPLRVAIAGKVKAGKSTLLNALVGETIAPTDAGECTTVVTWYRNGTTYRVHGVPLAGAPQQLAFTRLDGSLAVDLAPFKPDDLKRIEIEWPTASLRAMTLIDTPGIDSLNPGVSAQTHRFLSSAERSANADAVLYLMRHVHQSDLHFLESFHDQIASHPTPANAIGVLSRADEIGAGRIDAMRTAQRIATQYGQDRRLRRMVQAVLPMAGLLASTATTLREVEYSWLCRLSEQPNADFAQATLSVDRFLAWNLPTVGTDERAQLLERLGVFGLRLANQLITSGKGRTSHELADNLRRTSGLDQLVQMLATQFSDRAEVLRARSALLRMNEILAALPDGSTGPLRRDLDRIAASAHEFRELQLLNALRAGLVALSEADSSVAERLLGAAGSAVHHRLGADESTSTAELEQRALALHGHWRRFAENPMSSREATTASQILVRTCEGLIAALGAHRRAELS